MKAGLDPAFSFAYLLGMRRLIANVMLRMWWLLVPTEQNPGGGEIAMEHLPQSIVKANDTFEGKIW